MTGALEKIFEMDLARSGIISVQRDMPDELTAWEANYQIGMYRYRVEAVARHGRPHGLDNDIILYLQSLFLRSGCPEHNRVATTANQILLNALGSNSKKEYERLSKALLRLAGTSWTLYRDVTDQKGKSKGLTTTNYIFTLEMEDWVEAATNTRRELVGTSKIVVRFADEFAHAIRMGLFQLLDSELLERLGHTNARSLYRVLQGHRVQPDGSLAQELQMPLSDWLPACGLETERLDNAKRILDAAHRRMVEAHYLQAATLQGRGASGTIHYIFEGLPEPALVEALMKRRVTKPVAEALAGQHPERVLPALRVVEERLATGWKPRSVAAAVVDAVRDPAKWGYLATPPKAKAAAEKAKPKREEEPPPPPAKEVAISFLKMRLGRPPSLYAQAALEELTEEELRNLNQILMKPPELCLPEVSALLGDVVL